MQTVTRDYKSLPHASVCGLSLYIGQRNDVLLRPKIGKIVINPIPLLMTMYSIRTPETLGYCSLLNRWRKWFFGPHPSGPWENLNIIISVKCHLCSLILGMWVSNESSRCKESDRCIDFTFLIIWVPRPFLACQTFLFSYRFTNNIHVGYQTKFLCDYTFHKNNCRAQLSYNVRRAGYIFWQLFLR